MDFSVVVPCYNESGNLVRLAEAFRKEVQNYALTDVEVVFVDNGSTDDSRRQIEEICSEGDYSFIRPVTVPINQGYGWGILSGLAAARGEFLAWTHADLQTPPADVFEGWMQLLNSQNPRRTIVRGVRIGRPWTDAVFTRAMGCVSSIALGTQLFDINAQPKIFHRDFLLELGAAPTDFSLDLYALYLARQLGYHSLELPVHFGERQAGIAKGGGTLKGKVKLCKRTLAYILQLRNEMRRTAGEPSPFEPERFIPGSSSRAA